MTLFSFYLHSDSSIQIWFMTFFSVLCFHDPYLLTHLINSSGWHISFPQNFAMKSWKGQLFRCQVEVWSTGDLSHGPGGLPWGNSAPLSWPQAGGEFSIKGDHCMVHSAHAQTGTKEGRFSGCENIFFGKDSASRLLPEGFHHQGKIHYGQSGSQDGLSVSWDFIITIYCPNCPSRATLFILSSHQQVYLTPRMRKWQDQALVQH